MNYYFIVPDLNLEVVGVSDQVRATRGDFHIEDPNFIDNYYFDKAENPKLAQAILAPKAILTDYINTAISGFSHRLLISDKLNNILTNASTGNFQFFKNELYQNDKCYYYWLVHPIDHGLDCINFSKTELLLRKKKVGGGTELVNHPQVKNSEEFLAERYTLKSKKERLMLNKVEVLNDNIDFFCLRYMVGGPQYIVSEKIKMKIEAQNITGLKFQMI